VKGINQISQYSHPTTTQMARMAGNNSSVVNKGLKAQGDYSKILHEQEFNLDNDGVS
jgi:hypothetical protein